ncbi:hypothetical protein ACFOYU_15540 [Microvirga sp. GCM10011540]|uniref:hypothetical protein n=1 Tax=Microvirga sp. GCM10011540 TaxID=3317338 RepID=UPI0036078145
MDRDEAEISITVRWPADVGPAYMHWRFFEKAFWRPLLSPEGEAILEPGTFERLLREGDAGWGDYPFLNSVRLYGVPAAPFDLPEEPPPMWRVRAEERADAIARAQAIAEHDLISVNGTIYRRSRPPMWAFGGLYRYDQESQLKLVMPEHSHRQGYFFSLNRRDEALAFAAQMAHRLPLDDTVRQRQLWPTQAQEVEITYHDAVTLPDDHAFSFVQTYQQVDHILQPVRFGDLPSDLLAAHVKLGEASELLTRSASSSDHQMLFGDAVAAVDAIAACTFPLSQPSRTHLERAVNIARVQQWRTEFEKEQGDIEALADM